MHFWPVLFLHLQATKLRLKLHLCSVQSSRYKPQVLIWQQHLGGWRSEEELLCWSRGPTQTSSEEMSNGIIIVLCPVLVQEQDFFFFALPFEQFLLSLSDWMRKVGGVIWCVWLVLKNREQVFASYYNNNNSHIILYMKMHCLKELGILIKIIKKNNLKDLSFKVTSLLSWLRILLIWNI